MQKVLTTPNFVPLPLSDYITSIIFVQGLVLERTLGSTCVVKVVNCLDSDYLPYMVLDLKSMYFKYHVHTPLINVYIIWIMHNRMIFRRYVYHYYNFPLYIIHIS